MCPQSTASPPTFADILPLFQEEVAVQCQFAIMAMTDMYQALWSISQAAATATTPPPDPPVEPPTSPPDLSNLTPEQAEQAIAAHQQDWDTWRQARDEWIKGFHMWNETRATHLQSEIATNTYNLRRVFAALQAFLTAAANISKLLWPEPRDARNFPDRRPQLWQSFNISLPSPLESRDLRNHFEHFDQRLDEFFHANPGGSMFDMNLLSVDVMASVPPGAMYRNFDPDTMCVWFGGQVFTLRPVIRAILALDPVAQEKAEQHQP